jgi:hypothetical protein
MLSTLLILSVAVVAGCGRASFDAPQQARDPVLAKLNEPPVNRPQKRASTSVVPQNVQGQRPVLPPGDRPGMVVFSDGHLVSRALTLSGRLTNKSGLIEFAAENQTAIQILYRLPQQLPFPPDVTNAGSLVFIDRSNPGGPDRRLIVSTDDIPLLAEVWLKSPAPITVELGPGLQLTQRPGPPEGIHDVPVEIVQRMQGSQLLSVGAVTTVKAPTGLLRTFIEASYTANSSDPTGQYPGGYVLHAWVVRSGP